MLFSLLDFQFFDSRKQTKIKLKVSRIGFTSYTHGGESNLAIQIDAAVNSGVLSYVFFSVFALWPVFFFKQKFHKNSTLKKWL